MRAILDRLRPVRISWIAAANVGRESSNCRLGSVMVTVWTGVCHRTSDPLIILVVPGRRDIGMVIRKGEVLVYRTLIRCYESSLCWRRILAIC